MPSEPPEYAHCAKPEPPVTMMLFHFSGGNPGLNGGSRNRPFRLSFGI